MRSRQKLLLIGVVVGLLLSGGLLLRWRLASHPGSAIPVRLVEGAGRLSIVREPLSDDVAAKAKVPVDKDRHCLELRLGQRIPLRYCGTPSAGAMVPLMGAAQFRSNGQNRVIMTALVSLDVASVRLSGGLKDVLPVTAAAIKFENRHDRGVALSVACEIANCTPTVSLLDANNKTIAVYGIDMSKPFGQMVPR